MLTYCAKKINIYYRDIDKINNIDIIFTYLFILGSIFTFCIYTYQYYNIVKHDLSICENNNTHRSCLKSELSIIIIPYVGTTYGFFTTFYKVTDIIACIIGCLCCCKPIEKENNNITIEMNPV